MWSVIREEDVGDLEHHACLETIGFIKEEARSVGGSG
jgi:hypothetical protein